MAVPDSHIGTKGTGLWPCASGASAGPRFAMVKFIEVLKKGGEKNEGEKEDKKRKKMRKKRDKEKREKKEKKKRGKREKKIRRGLERERK